MNGKKTLDELYLFKIMKSVPQSVVVFFTVFITGILTNGLIMAGGYVNGDGLAYGSYYQVSGWDISQGRWGLIPFSDRFVNSWFDSLLALSVLAVAAIYILKILRVKSVAACIGICMLIATQTHFAQWQGSTYILFPYATAFMCSVLAVWFINYMSKSKIRILSFCVAVLLLAFSLGIYQAYLAVTVTLILFELITEFTSQKPVKPILIKTLCYLGLGIAAAVLYILIMRISLRHYGVQMTAARGWSDALQGNLPIFSSMGYTFKNVYKLFGQLLFVDGIRNYGLLHKVIYIFLFGLLGYGLLRWSARANVKIWYRVVVWIGVLCVPVAVCLLRMVTETVIPWSMFPAVIMVPIGIIAFFDRMHDNIKVKIYLQYLLALGCAFLIVESMYISNVAYNNLQKRNAKTFANAVRLLDAVETAEGYEKEMPVIFIGSMGDTYKNTLKIYEETLYGYEAYVMDFLPFHGTGSHGWHKFINDNLGVSLVQPSDYNGLYMEICEGELLTTMEVFPKEGCIEIYRDTLVVKLSEIK